MFQLLRLIEIKRSDTNQTMAQVKNMTEAEALDVVKETAGRACALLQDMNASTPLPEVKAAWFELQAANCAMCSFLSWRKGVPPPDPDTK